MCITAPYPQKLSTAYQRPFHGLINITAEIMAHGHAKIKSLWPWAKSKLRGLSYPQKVINNVEKAVENFYETRPKKAFFRYL